MRRAKWLIAAALLPAAGCGGEREMVHFCTLAYECGCDSPQDVGDCLNYLLQDEALLRAEAEQAGAHFDGDCLRDMYAAHVDHLGCKSSSETLGALEHVLRCEVCEIVHGDKQEGAGCRSFGHGSDCAPGLDCVAGICVDTCTERALGAACTFTATNGLTYTYPCKDGVCDAAAGVCVAALADGGACTSSWQCRSEWCNDSGVCGLPKIGDSCEFARDCGPWRRCLDGACASWPGEGEACGVDGGCDRGNVCDGSICVAEGPWLCPAG